MNLLEVVGNNIRACRNRLGISQEKLAELSGLHRTYVGGVERGERNISILNLDKIAAALKVRPDALLRKKHAA